jgi:two-component system, OmpR family, response regulator CpxR
MMDIGTPGAAEAQSSDPAKEPASGADSERASITGRQWDVLVVEDDNVLAGQLAQLLENEGYTVQVASNGLEAFQLLFHNRVGLLVLDLMMPVMSGWDLLETIRQTPSLHELPVFIITAFANVDRAVGGTVFLKPLNVRSLVRGVKVRLGPRTPGDAPPPAGEPAPFGV